MMSGNDGKGWKVWYLAVRASYGVYIRDTTTGRLITALHRKHRNNDQTHPSPLA